MVKDEALGRSPRLSGTLAPVFQFEINHTMFYL